MNLDSAGKKQRKDREFRFRRAEKDQRAIYDHYIARRKEKQP